MEIKDILLLLAGAVISLVINYITQYTSNPLANKFREWRNRQAQKRAVQSIAKAKQRIEKIEKELTLIRWYIDNPVAFHAFGFDVVQDLIRKLFFFGLLAVGASLMPEFMRTVILVTLFLFLYVSSTSIDREKRVDHIFRKVKNFHIYEPEMRKQIAELQKVVNTENPEQTALVRN